MEDFETDVMEEVLDEPEETTAEDTEDEYSDPQDAAMKKHLRNDPTYRRLEKNVERVMRSNYGLDRNLAYTYCLGQSVRAAKATGTPKESEFNAMCAAFGNDPKAVTKRIKNGR